MRAYVMAAALALIPSIAAAELPVRLACVADDTYWVWYGEGLRIAPADAPPIAGQRIVGSRLLEPNEQFRIQERQLYFVDGFGKEYLYGTLTDHGLRQVQSSNWIFMFDETFRSSVGVRTDELNTRVYSYKCVPG